MLFHFAQVATVQTTTCSCTYVLYYEQEKHSEFFLLRSYQNIYLRYQNGLKIKFNLIIPLFSFPLNHIFIFKAMK